MNFRVGQKVVCVDDSPARDGLRVPLIKDHVYTVSGIDPIPDFWGDVGIYLYEVKCEARVSGGWIYYDNFRATRFRPVVERKTDISIFQRMLTNTDVKRREPIAE